MMTVRCPGPSGASGSSQAANGCTPCKIGLTGWTISAVNSAPPCAITFASIAPTSPTRMKRDEAVAGPDERGQRLLLRGTQRHSVAVDHDCVVILELSGIEGVRRRARVGQSECRGVPAAPPAAETSWPDCAASPRRCRHRARGWVAPPSRRWGEAPCGVRRCRRGWRDCATSDRPPATRTAAPTSVDQANVRWEPCNVIGLPFEQQILLRSRALCADGVVRSLTLRPEPCYKARRL